MVKQAAELTDVHDPFFGAPFIDVDEWREAPVRHRYVHGGFQGTDTRFSFYLPPPERWQGRFLQTLEGGDGGHEDTAQRAFGKRAGIDFAIAAGAYLVESNQGHFGSDLSILRTEPSVHAYQASAASARFSRAVAAEMYGREPAHGYVYGGSGGSARCILCLENAPDVWDGAVPFIMGHGTSWSLGFSVQANAARLLGSRIDAVIDASEVGGSGDPFATLDSRQREALAAMYRSGFPRGAEGSFGTSGYASTFASHVSALIETDPTYFDDFWSVRGYAGADGELDDALVEFEGTVSAVLSGAELQTRVRPDDDRGRMLLAFASGSAQAPLAVEVDGVDTSRLIGATLRLLSGGAAGRELYCVAVVGGAIVGRADLTVRFEGVEPGDRIAIDNRRYLGYCYFHRHQVEAHAPEYGHLMVDGRPLYPQRESIFSRTGMLSGGLPTGKFAGRMIVVQNAHDAACWPNAAVSYRRLVERHLGDRIDDHYRLWYFENAAHIPASSQPAGRPPVVTTRLIDYGGCLEQALADLIDWVENGRPPSPTTGFEVTADQELRLAPAASARHGIQPVVRLGANGGSRAEVRAGDEVVFECRAEMPPGAGMVTGVEWDFEGLGEWALRESGIDGTSASVSASASHRYEQPGTYFPAVRVTAHRQGQVGATLRQLVNLGRARVVVA